MSRDFGQEIDELKAEIERLKLQVSPIRLPATQPHGMGKETPVISPQGSQHLNAVRDELLALTQAQSVTGALAAVGTFCSGSGDETRQSIWISTLRTDALLDLNEKHMVENVLASVGNSQRLGILLALLKKPQSVAQLVETLGANTTGQIYHHIKPLLAADLVREEKGVYAVIPYRVQGIIMLLAGVWDLVDPRYSSGAWEDQDQGN
jgi:hypothetical protein